MLCLSRKVCKFTINILLSYKTLCALSVYNQKVHTIVSTIVSIISWFSFLRFFFATQKK